DPGGCYSGSASPAPDASRACLGPARLEAKGPRQAILPAVNPKRQSVPETGAYRIVAIVLADLRRAERALTIVEEAAPDAERAAYLAELRAAIERLARLPPST